MFLTQNPSVKKLELCCFLSLKGVIFLQIHFLVLIVSFKNGAKLHTSGCGHNGRSSSSTATRGKQNWCTSFGSFSSSSFVCFDYFADQLIVMVVL